MISPCIYADCFWGSATIILGYVIKNIWLMYLFLFMIYILFNLFRLFVKMQKYTQIFMFDLLIALFTLPFFFIDVVYVVSYRLKDGYSTKIFTGVVGETLLFFPHAIMLLIIFTLYLRSVSFRSSSVVKMKIILAIILIHVFGLYYHYNVVPDLV